MSITKFVNLDNFLRVKVWLHQFPDGASQVTMNCATQDCDRKCAMSYRTLPVDWRVTPEHHAAKFSTLCAKLEKLDDATVRPVGQKSLI